MLIHFIPPLLRSASLEIQEPVDTFIMIFHKL
jgi:hypothetical protein